MGAFRMKFFKVLKTVFIIGLLVRFRVPCNQLLSQLVEITIGTRSISLVNNEGQGRLCLSNQMLLLKVTFLQQILLPSVSRFLSDEVMVVTSSQSDPLSTPAVTFCPYDQSK